jgi:hypothetical protein
MKKLLKLIIVPILAMMLLCGCSSQLFAPKDKVYIANNYMNTSLIHSDTSKQTYAYTITATFVNPTNTDIEVFAQFTAKQSLALDRGWTPTKSETFVVPAKQQLIKSVTLEFTFFKNSSKKVTDKFTISIISQNPLQS